MNRKNSWKSILPLVGLVVIMMTAASVCAEEPLAREDQLADDTMVTENLGETEGDTEPLLIAPLEEDDPYSTDPADDGNFTDTMVISPGPKESVQASIPLDWPVLGIVGAVVVIALALIGIAIRRK